MNKVKILVVEDAVVTAGGIKKSLESSGYIVPAIAASAEDAIKKVEEHKPDLILMDIILKGEIDGIKTADVIQSRFDIPIVYLSALTDKKTLERAKITEPFGYITKPFDDQELLSTIEMAIYKHRMEMKLKKSEKQYKTLIETIRYGIQENDTAGIITFSNLAHTKMLGYESGELLSKAIWDFFASDEEKNNLRKYLKKLVKEQPSPTPFESKNLTKDGRLIDVRVDWNYKRDKEGNLAGFISVISDITDHKHSEMALQKSREQLRAIIDNSTTVIYLKDIKGKYILINSRYEDLFHTTKEEIIGKTDFDIFPKDMAEAFQRNDRKVLEKRSPIEFEEYAPHDDGVHSYISIKFPLFDFSENINGICGISTDITERKQAEDAIKENERRLKEAQEVSLTGSYFMDIETSEVTWSDQQYRIFGYQPGEVTPTFKFVLEHVHPDDRESFIKRSEEAFAARKLYNNEYRIITKDGIEKHVHSKAKVEEDCFGKLWFKGTLQDITERKKIENEQKNFSKKLVESQELERKRIASELHDGLAQNMMIISNEIHKIISNSPKKTKDRESLNLASSLALQSIDDIDRIVNDLRPHQLDHLGLTKAITWLAKKIAKSSGINILTKINVMPDIIPSATEIHIYRIIQEGINNIVKHSIASKGRIELKGLNEHIDILISDDGKGFECNSRHAKNTIHKGFGLQGIEERAKMCGGILTIDSYPGKGTTLKITIPVQGRGK